MHTLTENVSKETAYKYTIKPSKLIPDIKLTKILLIQYIEYHLYKKEEKQKQEKEKRKQEKLLINTPEQRIKIRCPECNKAMFKASLNRHIFMSCRNR